MRAILSEGLTQLNIVYNERMLDQFCAYGEYLRDYNQKVNLTAITEPSEIAVKHFLDCAALLCVLPMEQGATMIDVGSGAGFPGLVLKILRPDIKLTLLDSLMKRIEFLRQCSDLLKLEDIHFVHSRAEDGGSSLELREQYDIATARAVAGMNVLCELCMPYVKVGGVFAALKGPSLPKELKEAAAAITTLGGEDAQVISVPVPLSDFSRHVAIVKKVRHTPTKYPRKAGVPSKKPLR